MKLFMKCFTMLATILFCLFVSSQVGQAKGSKKGNNLNYRIIAENNKYGVVDTSTGDIVIKFTYERLYPGGINYIAVKRGLWGVIDINEEVVVDFTYDTIRNDDSYYIVGKKIDKKEVLYGVISEKGDTLIPIKYCDIKIILIKGSPPIIKVRKVKDNYKYGLININNEILLPLEYNITNVSGLSDQILVTVQNNYKIETVVVSMGNTQQGISRSDGISKFKKGDLYGYKKGDGQEFVAPIFDDAWDFKNGFARVKRSGKWGLLNEKGEEVIEPKYDYIWDFGDGKVKVRLENGDTKYIELSKVDQTETRDDSGKDKAIGVIKRINQSSMVAVIAIKKGVFIKDEEVSIYSTDGNVVCTGNVKSVYKDEVYISIEEKHINFINKNMLAAKNYNKNELLEIDKKELAVIDTKEDDIWDGHDISVINRLQKSKPKVIYIHSKHNDSRCGSCHSAMKTYSKDDFHKFCKECHQKNKIGPVKCDDCHKK